jgi:hypothetical protein
LRAGGVRFEPDRARRQAAKLSLQALQTPNNLMEFA